MKNYFNRLISTLDIQRKEIGNMKIEKNYRTQNAERKTSRRK